MPLESASFINQLVVTNPTHQDDISQADAQLRLIKSAVKATFPNLGAAVTASDALMNAVFGSFSAAGAMTTAESITLKDSQSTPTTTNTTAINRYGAKTFLTAYDSTGKTLGQVSMDDSGNVNVSGTLYAASVSLDGTPLSQMVVPSGGIIMWSGATTNVPAGFVLCNGQNGSPDLRDRFIVGAGGSYTQANFGGAAAVTVSTDSQGSHSHTGNTGSGGSTSGTGTTTSAGSHSHGGNTASYTLTQNDIPSHTHGVAGEEFSVGSGSGSFYALNTNNSAAYANSLSTGGGGGHSHGISSDGAHTHDLTYSVPAHTHGISTDGTHTHSVSVQTLPPYYALCFIMKS